MKLLVLALLLAQGDDQSPELTQETYKKWLKAIVATSEEDAWRKPGWRTSLAGAAKEARDSGRPVLLWAMNGHPCGAV